MLSQELVNDVLAFCNDIHDTKTELLKDKLLYQFGSESKVKMGEVVKNIGFTCIAN